MHFKKLQNFAIFLLLSQLDDKSLLPPQRSNGTAANGAPTAPIWLVKRERVLVVSAQSDRARYINKQHKKPDIPMAPESPESASIDPPKEHQEQSIPSLLRDAPLPKGSHDAISAKS
ncbi:hypothetical protein AVEN_205554-1 [Araneus ventricosus]|uniref:Uncharacterized protein n=1 Tax=Araneus ventricosus TaxID=182803 RepID=A0A4Y2URD4_ARAVE|nr:hypothetical protein AVEN_205554-1 [Araneus ventricosus]